MNVYWQDSEKTILIRELSEPWSWEAYETTVRQMYRMLLEVNHDVFVIVDARNIKSVPKDSLSYFYEANQNIPAHVRMRILVTKNSLIHTLFDILQKVVPRNFQNYYCLPTIEEAQQKIAEAKAK